MALVITEYDLEPAPDAWQKLKVCLAVREVQSVAVYRSLDHKRRIQLCEAPDAQSVREAHHSAGVAFAHCWTAERL